MIMYCVSAGYTSLDLTCKVVCALGCSLFLSHQACRETPLLGMKPYCYMLLEGQKVSLGVHPDSVITQDYSLADGTLVHVIVGEEEQRKLFALQGILDEEG